MDWGVVNTVLTVVFGIVAIVSIIVAIRLAQRKKPVWAYSTNEIIELRKGTPPELKLLYNDAQVTGVYRTYVIFFNRGKRAIQETDVKKPIKVSLTGAQILGVRTVKQSKDTIDIDAMMDEFSPIDLVFPYLDHNDGLLLEILHTKYDKLTCTGYILEAGEPKYIGKFAQFPHFTPRFVIAYGITALIVLLTPPLLIYGFLKGLLKQSEPILLLALIGWLSMLQRLIPLPRGLRFPSWSRLRETKP